MVQETSQSGTAEQQGPIGSDPAVSPVAVPSQGGDALILEKIQALEENNKRLESKNGSRSHSLSGG